MWHVSFHSSIFGGLRGRAVSAGRQLVLSVVVCLVMGIGAQAFATTTTTLAVTSAGSSVTSVPALTVVTLTATVVSGSTPVTTGQVTFCDAAAPVCSDIHLLGLAQLTSAGTATLKFRPGIGSHSYKAVFLGTNTHGRSSSSNSSLEVTGKYPTAATITDGGVLGYYSLTGMVGGNGSAPPTGTVSFLDTSNDNAVLGTAPLVAGPAGLNFLNYSNVAAGSGSYSLALGDFNRDGIPDLVVTNYSGTSGVVLLGNGDGTFSPVASQLSDTGGPAGVADFNGDGIPDLLTFPGDGIVASLGNGDGTFRTQAALDVPFIGNAVIGDFRGEGIPDVATLLYIQDSSTQLYTVELEICFGNGDGTFRKGPVALSFPNSGSVLLAAGDFNGDGNLDLAITAGVQDCCDGTVTVLLGDGTGNFTPTVSSLSTGPGTSPTSIAIGDFNADGIPDLVMTDQYIGNSYVFLGNGDGTFEPVQNVPTGSESRSVAVADFNGDGVSDFAEAHYYSDQVSVSLAENQTAVATATGIMPTGPAGTHEVIASYSSDSDYSANDSQPLAVYGTGAALSVSSLSFGNQLVGTKSGRLDATLTNYGPAAFTVTKVQLTGANASQFQLSTDCLTKLHHGSNCTISVFFEPTATGVETATVQVEETGSLGSVQAFTLTGTGVVPGAILSTTSVSFGNQVFGTVSAQTRGITLTNTGGAALEVSSVVLTGTNAASFRLKTNCDTNLQPGVACNISVQFAPNTYGHLTGAVTITDNAGMYPQTISLDGYGTY